VAFALDKQQEAAVVADQPEAAGLLARAPANPFFADFSRPLRLGAAPLKLNSATHSPSTSAT